jgi:D-3-phosphoglycerate dehydrogenase
MFRIWLERPLPQAYKSLLDGRAVVIGTAEDSSEDPLSSLKEAQAIIAGGRLDYGATLMDRAPQIRVISRTGIGVDKVAVEEATSRGIAVCNAPDAPTISTAEHAISLMLAVGQQLKWCHRSIRPGANWISSPIMTESIFLEPRLV